MAQSGYPWTLDLHVLYDLSADGLTVTQTATNLGDRARAVRLGRPPLPDASAPARSTAGSSRCRPSPRLLVRRPACSRSGEEPVDGTAYDFRVARPLRDTVLDDAFGDLDRDDAGRRHRRGARPRDRPRRRAVGRPAPPAG